jgi:glycosyltransferase involved in cell wall biosynthesis
MHVVHDGIEGELFRDAAPTTRNGVTRIGLVGRISPFKGQHVFLEAASAIRRRFPNAHFQIIGGALFAEDDYESRIRGMAAAPLLQNAVEFTGFRSDVPALISKLDILVHASTTGEPFGQVVVEGMAAGKPVVATRGGGVPEIVVDGVTGWLVPMADAPALAEAVCRLLQDPTAAADMGRRGQERALACFSVSSTAANVERLYTDHVFRGSRLTTTVPQEDRPLPQPLRVRPPARAHRRDASHRILIVSHSAAPSGAEMAMLNLCRHLDRRYYTPVVLFCSDGPMVAEFGRIAVETHVLPLAPAIVNTRIRQLRLSSVFRLGDLANLIAYVARLSRFIRFQRIACVHTNSLKSHVLGGMAAQLARVPVLWHVRNRIDSNYLPGPAAPFFRALCRVLPDYVVSVSAAVRDLLRLRRGAHAEGAIQTQSSVVHDGVDHRRFGAEPARTLSAPALVGLVGRISPFKGQHIFLQAAAIVRQRFPNTQFQIIGTTLFGEDDYARHLQTLCRTFALEDCVQFTGFEGDIPHALSRLDVVVHASTMGEPFGQVIIEAMAAGKPVVATDGGGVPEIIQHDVTGYLVPMEDATAMADAIGRLLADPERAAEMGRCAQQRVKSHFTIEASASKLHDVYRHLLDRMTIRHGNDLIYRTSKPWAMSRIHGIFILLFAFLSLLYLGLLALD